MRKQSDREILKMTAKCVTAVSVFVFAAFLCFFCFSKRVKADSEVVVSAVARQTEIGPGDILIIDVVADRMPGITDFGPILFNYDSDKADFMDANSFEIPVESLEYASLAETISLLIIYPITNKST